MMDPFMVVVYFSLLVPFCVILYEGAKNVFPHSSKALNLAIALSMSSIAATLVTSPILALLGLQSFPTFLSIPSMFGLILGALALFAVLAFLGLFVYCGFQLIRLKISSYRALRHPYREILPPPRRITRVPRRERRPSGLILELDLTEDNT